MAKYYIDEQDLSRYNLFKVNEYIQDINKQLWNCELEPLIKEELESILITLQDKRSYILDMKHEKSL